MVNDFMRTISPINADQEQPDWKEVLFEVLIKILTLGFYHIKKHK